MIKRIIIISFLFATLIYSQTNIYEPVTKEDLKYSLKDFGKMWTFDDLPLDYFQSEYGFEPTTEWIEKVQKSALQFGNGCSAAFVSEDGLIMTNHHCGRGDLGSVQKEGENLLRDGFYASTLSEERTIPDLFVDQLILIEDVTTQIRTAMNASELELDKANKRDEKIKELEEKYAKETGLVCKVVTLYNGGKYSMYCYKRYTDVRLVMSPDFQIASTGWDWDNFTYPRYELDFAFYRAYNEDGKPVKTENYFSWSKKGAAEGELVFTVGRPGSTERLYPYEQLEFFRDNLYPMLLNIYNELYAVYFELFQKYPERKSELLNRVMGYGNARKSFAGRYLGLTNDVMMSKKKDFQNELIAKINKDELLSEKYKRLWKSVDAALNEYKSIYPQFSMFNVTRALYNNPYFRRAEFLIKYAQQMKLPEDEREEMFKQKDIKSEIEAKLFADADLELANLLLKAHAKNLNVILGNKDELVKKMYGGYTGQQAVDYLLKNTSITNKEEFFKFLDKKPDEILASQDPLIVFILYIQNEIYPALAKVSEINKTLDILNQHYADAVFEVFGSNLSPDATSTLRLSDGVIAGYEYNGTIAPAKTTYYGMYDRYVSFGKKDYPWGLHERWQTPAPSLNLELPMAFASTNDIVGGNSGSSVINKDAEVVGLVHDGNLESLAGHFIYIPENNRTVSTDSYGLMEALKHVFKTERLVKELEAGKIIK